jgi:hypothetical protein
MTSTNRLLKEFGELKKSNDLNFFFIQGENNLNNWEGFLKGPYGTPFQVSKKYEYI